MNHHHTKRIIDICLQLLFYAQYVVFNGEINFSNKTAGTQQFCYMDS